MSEINAVYNQMIFSADELKNSSTNVRAVGNSVNSIALNLSSVLSTSLTNSYISRLKNISQDILNVAAKMNTFSDAVRYIMDTYKLTDCNVAGNTAEASEVGNSIASNGLSYTFSSQAAFAQRAQTFAEGILAALRLFLIKLNLIPAQKQERVDGETVSCLQEQEQDLYMQQQVNAINRDNRFSEEAWNNASFEERKELLNEYTAKVAAILGINITQAEIFDRAPKDGYITMGYYSSDSNTININSYILKNNDYSSSSVYSTIVHELRHGYQHAVCNDPSKFVVTDETVASWQNSFDNYKSTQGFMREGMDQKSAFEAYRNQVVERDARWFAKQD